MRVAKQAPNRAKIAPLEEWLCPVDPQSAACVRGALTAPILLPQCCVPWASSGTKVAKQGPNRVKIAPLEEWPCLVDPQYATCARRARTVRMRHPKCRVRWASSETKVAKQDPNHAKIARPEQSLCAKASPTVLNVRQVTFVQILHHEKCARPESMDKEMAL